MGPVLSGVIAATAVFAMVTFLARANPRRQGASSGKIGPSWIMRATAFAALLMAAACAYGFLLSEQSPALILAICFGLTGLWVFYMTLPEFSVFWDENGITGPSSALFPPQRLTIAWSEVAGVTPTLAGSIRVQAADGRCIYWSAGFSGHQLPVLELKRRRPDVF